MWAPRRNRPAGAASCSLIQPAASSSAPRRPRGDTNSASFVAVWRCGRTEVRTFLTSTRPYLHASISTSCKRIRYQAPAAPAPRYAFSVRRRPVVVTPTVGEPPPTSLRSATSPAGLRFTRKSERRQNGIASDAQEVSTSAIYFQSVSCLRRQASRSPRGSSARWVEIPAFAGMTADAVI